MAGICQPSVNPEPHSGGVVRVVPGMSTLLALSTIVILYMRTREVDKVDKGWYFPRDMED